MKTTVSYICSHLNFINNISEGWFKVELQFRFSLRPPQVFVLFLDHTLTAFFLSSVWSTFRVPQVFLFHVLQVVIQMSPQCGLSNRN